jgi:hypothetical protein
MKIKNIEYQYHISIYFLNDPLPIFNWYVQKSIWQVKTISSHSS